MFSGNWSRFDQAVRALFAGAILFLIVICIYQTGVSTGQSEREQERNSAQYAGDAEQEIENRCLLLEPVAIAECIQEVIEATNEHDRAENDLIAQSQMARWALWMAVMSGAAVVVTALGVYWVGETLVATRKAVEAASATNEIMREDRRAWINPNLQPYREIQVFDGGFHSQITLALENTGKSVAFDVRAFIRPYLQDSTDPSPRIAALDWLNRRMVARHPLEQGRIIFPGEIISFEPDLAMQSDGLDIARRFILRIAVLVQYRTAEVDGIRETYVTFDLTAVDHLGVAETIDLRDGCLVSTHMRVTKTGVGNAT
jgi:hypothetical protein